MINIHNRLDIPKIILVEGLPNSGKTTTLSIVKDFLKKKFLKTKVLYEDDLDNMLDNHCNAYLTNEEFKEFLKKHKPIEKELLKIREEFSNGYIIRYWKNKNVLTDEAFKELESFDFYNLPLEDHFELVDLMWNKFLRSIKKDDYIYVVECALIQNPMHVSVVRDNKKPEFFYERVLNIQSKLSNFNHLVLYISHNDIKNVLLNNSKRSIGWNEAILYQYTKGNQFGISRKLTGFEGLQSAYEELLNIQLNAVEQLNENKIIITNDSYDLNEFSMKIENKLLKYIGIL